MVKNGNVYTGYCSPNGNTWYEVGSTTVNFSSVNYLAGLAVTSHNGGLACTATFDNVSLAPSLPVGWTVAGIGSPSPAGGGGFANGTYTVVGGGGDIWNTSDEFDYASQSTSGDQTLVARVTSETDADSWSKAGVMFRDSAAADSMFVDILATPGNGVSMQWRNATGTRVRPFYVGQRGRAQRLESRLAEARQQRQHLYRLLFTGRHYLVGGRFHQRDVLQQQLSGGAGGHQPQRRRELHRHLRQREPDRQRFRQPGPAPP